MNLRPIIDDIARQADTFVTDPADRARARVELIEFIALEHPRLVPADRKSVADHVVAVLEAEDFFADRFVDSFDADQDTDEEQD